MIRSRLRSWTRTRLGCNLVAGAFLVVCLTGCARDPERFGDSPPSAAAAPLVLAPPVHHLDTLAREPMVVELRSGALLVAGYGSQLTGTDPYSVPSLWRSDDRGTTWNRVAVGSAAEGAAGNSDVDLAVAPDGTIYFISMGFDRASGAGVHISVGASPDEGATWSWTRLSQDHFDDRPWVEVAPDGTAHAIWNDGSGVSHATSGDRGRTWVERPRIHDLGGSSHLAIGPGGEIAVRITPLSASGNRFDAGVELVVVSVDGGNTWGKHPAPGNRVWDPTFQEPGAVPRWVEPVAWDDRGALYHLWSEGRELLLARSTDQGQGWERWQVAGGADDADIAYFPYLVAGPDGRLAATWFSGDGETFAAQVALLEPPRAAGETLIVRRAPPFHPDSFRSQEGALPTPDAGGEYVPVIFLSGGGLGVVSPIQNQAANRFGFSWWVAR